MRCVLFAALLFCVACPPAPGGLPPCETDADCPSNSSCTSAGTCVAGNPCDDVTCDPGTTCTAGECRIGGACGGEQRVFPPAVLFVQDRSCSMANALGKSGVTKWEAAVDALSNTAATLDDRLLFGLTLFPDTEGNRCEQSAVPVPINASNGAAIGELLQASLDGTAALYPDGPCVTNIDTAMEQAAELLSDGTLDAQVVLVTDGRQAACNEATGEADATATIRELRDNGIETVVVGFDRAADAAVLDAFADAGGRPNPDVDVDFYPATDPAALQTTLLSLADDSLDCAFTLRSEPPDPQALYLFVDEVPTAEFSYDAGRRVVTLTGDACAAISDGDDVTVEVVFGGCPP